MRLRTTLLALGTACVWLAGCGDDVESLTASVTAPTNAAGRVEFSTVKPILLEKCVMCHGEYADSAKLAEDAMEIAAAVEGYYMPAPGVSQLAPEDRIALLAWLHQQPQVKH